MSTFEESVIGAARPESIQTVQLPFRTFFRKEGAKEIPYYPSPVNWCGEVLYFLMVDRFSDNQEDFPEGSDPTKRPKFDRTKPFSSARSANFRFDKWAQGGGERWQGGNLKGIMSKLDYLADLGITTIWLSPVFKQRIHNNEYHGYAIQDFLEIDPHFGTRKELVDLIIEAHKRNIRIILDVIINHSGHNWDYQGGMTDPPYKQFPDFYQMGAWLDKDGNPTFTIRSEDDGVWPKEFQDETAYTRAGSGNLGRGDILDDHAEMRRTDFAGSFRDFNLDDRKTLSFLSKCYKYWIAGTDCDGLRIDTMKHITQKNARDFCNSIKEFADNLGKKNFFLVAEVAGGDDFAERYQNTLSANLNATLDIGDTRIKLNGVAKGLDNPKDYFQKIRIWEDSLGSHRLSAERHVKIMVDHDCVCGDKKRFSTGSSNDHQVNAGMAVLLLSMGIPCIYYGCEQGFAGPETNLTNAFLPDFGYHDKFLRENMFGGIYAKKSGEESLKPGIDSYDTTMPAFGAFGTVGYHFFDPESPIYKRVRELIRIRQKYTPLQYGRQYLRDIRNFSAPFGASLKGEIIAWSRILDEEEIVVVLNGHGVEARGADIIVDNVLNSDPASFRVIANTQQIVEGNMYKGAYKTGSEIPVKYENGAAFIEIRNVPPSEVIIMTNKE